MPRDSIIYSSRPSAADLPFEIGDDVDDRPLAPVIWHVSLGAEESGELLLLF